MLNISQSQSSVQERPFKHPRIIADDSVLKRFLSVLGCVKIYRHGYVERTVLQPGSKTKFEIPRIKAIYANGHSETHVLLPDFVLPYRQYSAKTITLSVCGCSTVEQSSFAPKKWDGVEKFWDELKHNCKTQYRYLKAHKPELIDSIKCKLRLTTIRPPRKKIIPLKHPQLRDYYFLTDETNVLNMRFFAHHIVSRRGSG